MVRVFIKGGVWKNSEDEILKAAVMKYGKQQWARVASLLNRKSAKQCKARWNEWLDPSIRKIEWSREEDEKLLHLAKLMPAQWKTIGPLVGGRTAIQCQERYEQLLDEAATAEGEHDLGGGDSGSSKKLRAGDIDPHPETKPARPDPIDMDEDEIEMLQEARARLANTQGKKAKRKAREKLLQEAKRLADLQKRRELKQAGLLSSAARTKSRSGKRARREIDLGVEIPFHKPAPAGFHATDEEDAMADEQRRKRLKHIDFQQINETQFKSRERDEKAAKRREESRLKLLERSNMQYVVAQTSKKNDPIAARKRGVLSLPEPTITDSELEKVAKLASEQNADNAAIIYSGKSGTATDALLGDYTDRPLPTPMRTPMTGSGLSKHEVIMREASALRKLERGQTPLLMTNETHENSFDGPFTDADMNHTSSVLTPMIGASATPMTSALDRSSLNQTPLSLGHRDNLGLNRPNSLLRHEHLDSRLDEDASVSGTSFATSIADRTMTIKELARAERNAAKRARRELEMALANLPAPQFEYELAAPEPVTDDDADERVDIEKDAADIEAEEIARLEKEARQRYEERSSVVKRLELPRPLGTIDESFVIGTSNHSSEHSTLTDIRKLIDYEAILLLHHDAFSFPVARNGDGASEKKSKKDKTKQLTCTVPPPRPLDFFESEQLDAAQEMLNLEVEKVIQEKRQLANSTNRIFKSDADFIQLLQINSILASSNESLDDHYDGQRWSSGESSKLGSLRIEFETLQNEIKNIRKMNEKIDSKFSIKTGGYSKRYEAFHQTALQSFAEIQNSRIEEVVYSTLMSQEKFAMQQRIEKLREDVEELEKIESVLQKRYGDLLHERNRQRILLSKMQQDQLQPKD